MKTDVTELEQTIEHILATTEYQAHPAYQALSQLWEVTQFQWERMDRLTRLSDSYQDMMIQREKSLSERFDKHLRQLEKITRISDRYQRSLRQLNTELEKTASMDPLTDLPNRRLMMKQLSQAFYQQGDTSAHKKSVDPLCIAMIDIDYFKQVNDDFGHQVGDDVLIALGQLMQNVVERHGVIGRWGGEEFLVILTSCPLHEAMALMELLRTKVSEFSLSVDESQVTTSVSIGVVEYQPVDSMDSLLFRADSALYSVKSKGRNSVMAG
ncbi:diguanylate cyclase domain-containing protein [Marinomonas sp. IMCC 4694]|uniref:diguanylate cyclase domain-containing protein n=1 Tax=Marinomonas sp. IMCC 4694 TaxID=2605432 RepID=UPI0011E66D01|nr:diguanylate cyclase [Marinomonas sp. IMCC 4694]TYL46782.1 GGDEF domain-containing protein [Marinomonas sp. IMCC 4694]